MRSIRLFTPQPLSPDSEVALDEVAGGHLIRVLRAKVGDPVTLFNGDGRDWQGTITNANKRGATVALSDFTEPATESPLTTHLGLCLSKGERFDWAVQKATEMGVSSITPLFSERVDVKLPADRIPKRVAHWQQIAASACEQSFRTVVPDVHAPTPLADWLKIVDGDVRLVLHHHDGGGGLPERAPASVALLVGPVGGLTDAEVSEAIESGFQQIKLGPRVMRTETAPAVALAIIGARWGDLS